jgi:hypothetical protein
LVLIETRYPIELKHFEHRVLRGKLHSGAERGSIVRFTPKTTGNAENANRVAHLCSPNKLDEFNG